MSAVKPQLRLVTYMCPSHPVELYELLMQYLEDEVGCEATLQYESRAPGPLPDRVDPFTADTVDLAFMSSTAFAKLAESGNEYAELLPVTPVFSHPQNRNEDKGYYSDVIIHKDGSKHIKEFQDLRGCRWAYSDEESLSSSIVVLKKLKELGENASFFGDAVRSGSHLKSLQLVLAKQAEAAAVDSNCLAYHQKYLQDKGQDVRVLESIGPLPSYPLVINKRLSGETQTRIMKALLNFSQTKFWGSRAEVYGLKKFVPDCVEVYERVKEYKKFVSDLNLGMSTNVKAQELRRRMAIIPHARNKTDFNEAPSLAQGEKGRGKITALRFHACELNSKYTKHYKVDTITTDAITLSYKKH